MKEKLETNRGQHDFELPSTSEMPDGISDVYFYFFGCWHSIGEN